MTALGALVGAGIIGFWTTMLWAAAGAAVGDIMSYWLGGHFHERIRHMWPFTQNPHWIDRGQRFFTQHGGTSIILGRFIGPMRPIVPMVAGMLNMPERRFIPFVIITALLWSPSYMLPGIAIGAASVILAPHVILHMLLWLLFLILIVWIPTWILRHGLGWLYTKIEYRLQRLWHIIKDKPQLQPITRHLRHPRHPEHHIHFVQASFLLLTIMLFAMLSIYILIYGPYIDINTAIYHVFRGLRNQYTDHVMLSITFLGDKRLYLAMTITLSAWLAIYKEFRTLWHWLLLASLTVVIAGLVKHGIQCPRPTGLVVTPKGYSFPSGHASLSTAFFTFLAIMLGRQRSKLYKTVVNTTAGILISMIIMSRLYLGAHWLTDVIGGLLLGASCALLVNLSYSRCDNRRIRNTGIIVVCLTTLCGGWLYLMKTEFETNLHNYQPVWPHQTLSAQEWWQTAGQNLPHHRSNRLGQPLKPLNVQWAGSLEHIQQSLIEQGWHSEETLSPSTFMSRLSSNEDTYRLPLLPELYQDRPPRLVMTKLIPHTDYFLVLRLWDADTSLLNQQQQTPLWLGTVAYHEMPHETWFLRRSHSTSPQTIPAAEALTHQLKHFQWKRAITCRNTQTSLLHRPQNHCNIVLLVRDFAISMQRKPS